MLKIPLGKEEGKKERTKKRRKKRRRAGPGQKMG
jgi:hypothetical protein